MKTEFNALPVYGRSWLEEVATTMRNLEAHMRIVAPGRLKILARALPSVVRKPVISHVAFYSRKRPAESWEFVKNSGGLTACKRTVSIMHRMGCDKRGSIYKQLTCAIADVEGMHNESE